MPTFRYEALNTQGQTVGGQIEAEGDRQAQRLLRKRGLTPVAVSAATAGPGRARLKRRSNVRDRILLLRELAVLIEAGVPLAEAVTALAHSRAEADLKTALENVSRDLRQGQGLTPSLRAHFGFLPGYVHQLVEAGEMTGQLKTALKDAVAQMEYDSKVATEMRSALFYPAFLLISAASAVLFIFVVVVPRFADMVKNRADALPFLSRAVLGTGLFVRDNLAFLALGAVALGFFIAYALRREDWRARALNSSLSLPVIGAWLTETETARWTKMLSTLLANRIPLLKALELARGALTAPGLRARLAQVERSVRGGTALSAALDEFVSFPTAVVNLIRVGERAGNLADMLASAATLTDESVRGRMAQVLAIIEPAAVIFIGGFVGLIVVSIFTAITSINQIPI